MWAPAWLQVLADAPIIDFTGAFGDSRMCGRRCRSGVGRFWEFLDWRREFGWIFYSTIFVERLIKNAI